MCENEEESMELSGESGLVSNLHQFSFNVSWSAQSRDPSPPQVRRRPLLSPSRFQVSTPISRDWKSLTIPRRTPIPSPVEMVRTSTVKVSQSTPFNSFREDNSMERKQNYSPMELDQSEASFETARHTPRIQKRHSDFGVSYDPNKEHKIVAPLTKITEFSNNSKIESNSSHIEAQGHKHNENNNNYKEDTFDLEDSVFLANQSARLDNSVDLLRHDKTRSRRKSMKKRKSDEKKSSHVMFILMILLLLGIAGYFLFQAGSCSVFDVDIVKLKHKLEDNVFGQQIAVKAVVNELEKFEQSVKGGASKRTLVMSFHGWTGVGKNFVSRFIAESFYNTKATLFSIPWHFPHAASNEEESRKLRKKVKNWIMGNITRCGVNVFIIDEIDKANSDFLSGLQSAMEEIRAQEKSLTDTGVMSPIIVILFISNSKAVQINQYLFSQIGVDRDRDQTMIDEFFPVFERHSNEWYSNLMTNNLIDIFVPFLPLAESHVRQCIVKDFMHKGRNPSERLIEAVMEELSFFDMGGSHGHMSLTGCKRVHDKVDLHIDD